MYIHNSQTRIRGISHPMKFPILVFLLCSDSLMSYCLCLVFLAVKLYKMHCVIPGPQKGSISTLPGFRISFIIIAFNLLF
jgi:hypothetical protein